MSISYFARNPLTIPRPRVPCLFPIVTNRLMILNLSSTWDLNGRRIVSADEKRPFPWRIRVLSSGERMVGSPQTEASGELSLDAFLSMAEVLFLIPPVVYSVGCVVGMLIPGALKPFQFSLGSKTFVWQFFLLVGSVVIGSLVRRRQWVRISRESQNGVGLNLLERIEKVEEDLRTSTTVVQVLSRKLEKLGLRFRVTRKALREPITETAALAQKNSEATRVLALQEDNLEKELGEVQKVLLAMQEQQQKQLELILTIAKAGRLLESKHNTSTATVQSKLDINSNPILTKNVTKQLQNQQLDVD